MIDTIKFVEIKDVRDMNSGVTGVNIGSIYINPIHVSEVRYCATNSVQFSMDTGSKYITFAYNLEEFMDMMGCAGKKI